MPNMVSLTELVSFFACAASVCYFQYVLTVVFAVRRVIKNAGEMLKRGLDKLLSFETSTGGFDWFGASPGHEALTAYGLLQFSAMASPATGMPNLIPSSLLDRVSKWLMDRKDGKGGFLRYVFIFPLKGYVL